MLRAHHLGPTGPTNTPSQIIRENIILAPVHDYPTSSTLIHAYQTESSYVVNASIFLSDQYRYDNANRYMRIYGQFSQIL